MMNRILKIFFLFLFGSFPWIGFAQNQKIDSLKFVLNKHKEKDSSMVNILNKLSKLYWQTGEYSKAKEIADEAIKISIKIEFRPGLSDSYGNIGIIHFFKGEYDKALEFCIKNLNIKEEIGDKQGMANAYNNIGVIYWNKGLYDKALEFYFKDLKIIEKIGDKQGLADSYNNIGLIYYSRNDYDRALEHFLNALKIYEKLEDNSIAAPIANVCINIGNIHQNKGDSKIDKKNQQEAYNVALEFFFKALYLFKGLGDKPRLADSYNNIGNIYKKNTEYDKSLEWHLQALNIRLEAGDKLGLARSFNNVGNLYLKQKKYIEARKELLKSLLLSEEIKEIPIRKETYLTLSILDSTLGNWQSAYNYHKLYTQMKDSIFNETSTKSIAEMQTKYETEKKEKEIELLNKTAEVTDLELKRGKAIQYGMAGGIAFLCLIGFLIFNQYRAKRKANIVLAGLNNRLADQNQKISEQNVKITSEKEKVEQSSKALKGAYDKLKDLQEFKESMTGMIVHDLKNPLNSIINFSQMEADRRNLQTINQSGKQMLNMVLNILDVQKFESASIKLNTSQAELKTVAESALAQVELLAAQKNIKIENVIPANVKSVLDVELISRVFVNLLTNAIKYTPASGSVKIGIEPVSESKIKVFVSDTGQGIPHDKLSMVFEKFAQVDAKKSGQVNSTGLGLTFCKMVLEAHNEMIDVESEEGKGTTFYFTINASEGATEVQIVSTNGTEMNEKKALSPEQINIITPEIEKLKTFNIYSTSQIIELVSGINDGGQKEIAAWKSEVENAVYNFDEEKYNELLKG